MADFDIVIVGGGIIGASLAYWLARADKGDLKICLVEARSQPASVPAASFASAGMVSPATTTDTSATMVSLIKRACQLYPQLVQELAATQPDLPTGYFELPQLRLASSEAEAAELQARQRWYVETGLVAEAVWLTAAEVGRIEPLAGPSFGAISHRAAIVRAAWLTQTLATAASRLGVTVMTGNAAGELLTTHGANPRLTGVKLADGTPLSTSRLVLAAGAWTGVFLDEIRKKAGLAAASPTYARQIFPVRGQMMAVRPDATTPNLQHLLAGGAGYAFPRSDGTVVFGATVEPEAGFEATTTDKGRGELRQLQHHLMPALDDAAIEDIWAGLRPGTDRELPMLGPVEWLDGLWLASGHYRSGVLLAPVTAELLADALLNHDVNQLADFGPLS